MNDGTIPTRHGMLHRMTPFPAQTGQITMADLWRPIAELEDKYEADLLIRAPELVDLDCNPHGVSIGYWQDGPIEVAGTEYEEGTWIAAGYDMCNDEFLNRACKPTHFLRCAGPVFDACRFCGKGILGEEHAYPDCCDPCADRERLWER